MNYLNKILNKLDINSQLGKLIKAEVKIPYLDDYNNVNEFWYPHPPCLLPIFLGHGASYKGIVKHFFIEKKHTFVEYELENNYFYEFARSEKQIFAQMILDMDMVMEGLNDEIIDFCNQINFEEYKKVDEFADEYGNISEHYNKLVYLETDTPIVYSQNLESYTGDYLSSEKIFNEESLGTSCSFEIVKKDFLEKADKVPLWFKKELDKKTTFSNHIANNDLDKAWLTLNSTGWLLKDVAEGLELLKTKTNDELFHLVADNWIEGWKNSNSKDGDTY